MCLITTTILNDCNFRFEISKGVWKRISGIVTVRNHSLKSYKLKRFFFNMISIFHTEVFFGCLLFFQKSSQQKVNRVTCISLNFIYSGTICLYIIQFLIKIMHLKFDLKNVRKASSLWNWFTLLKIICFMAGCNRKDTLDSFRYSYAIQNLCNG